MDNTTELFKIASPLFLYLSSFRSKIRKSLTVAVEDVAHDLEEIFEDQKKAVRSEAKLEALYEKARYPLVVLADEILLHSGWESAPQWEEQILEEKYFHTNIGGDQFFAIAKDLRPEDVELAAVLFAGLSLGFRGKYRERPDKLSEAKKKVYRVLAEYQAELGDKLTPEAYQVKSGAGKRIDPAITLARVAIVSVCVVIFYYITTYFIWSASLTEIRAAVKAMGL